MIIYPLYNDISPGVERYVRNELLNRFQRQLKIIFALICILREIEA